MSGSKVAGSIASSNVNSMAAVVAGTLEPFSGEIDSRVGAVVSISLPVVNEKATA